MEAADLDQLKTLLEKYGLEELVSALDDLYDEGADKGEPLPDEPERELRCSFCGKRREQVANLIAGPGVFICTECVALCNEVIGKQATGSPTNPERE